jgi:hypothetical protein
MWSLAVPHRSVLGDGSVLLVAELSDDNGLSQTVTVTMDVDRNLRLLCEPADGAVPLAGFEAWSV